MSNSSLIDKIIMFFIATAPCRKMFSEKNKPAQDESHAGSQLLL